MRIQTLDHRRVAEKAVEQLGLEPDTFSVDSAEALAAALRRAASFLCPTGPMRLIAAVETTILELLDPADALRDQLTSILDTLVGYGDLLELPGRGEERTPTKQLYLAPPAFIRRTSGQFLLFGVRPEAAPLVGDELLPLVEHKRHIRSLRTQSELDIEELLLASGLRELDHDTWLRAPRAASPGEVIEGYATRLAAAGPAGEVEGLRILDPSSPVTYYRGRWRPPSADDDGHFVARRPQAFGADLWCYAELAAGSPTRLVDLPVEALSRGCDEAWRLQAALDAQNGHPQRLRVRQTGDVGVIDVFSPIPRWFQRRWDSVGAPTQAVGALLSYSFASEEIAEEVAFASDRLWLRSLESDRMGTTNAV